VLDLAFTASRTDRRDDASSLGLPQLGEGDDRARRGDQEDAHEHGSSIPGSDLHVNSARRPGWWRRAAGTTIAGCAAPFR
jgi:hypothetical protein